MLTIRAFAANQEAEKGLTFAVETALRAAGFRWVSYPNGNAGWDQPVGLGLTVREWLQKWEADNGVSVDYFPGNPYCPSEAYVGRRDHRRQVAAGIMAQQPGQDYRLLAVKVLQQLTGGKSAFTPAHVESVMADIEPRATSEGPLKGRRLSEIRAVAWDEALIRTQTRGAAHVYAALRHVGGSSTRILGLARVDAEPGGYYVTAGLCHSMAQWEAWVDAALESVGIKS